jgi:hypothetical protein
MLQNTNIGVSTNLYVAYMWHVYLVNPIYWHCQTCQSTCGPCQPVDKPVDLLTPYIDIVNLSTLSTCRPVNSIYWHCRPCQPVYCVGIVYFGLITKPNYSFKPIHRNYFYRILDLIRLRLKKCHKSIRQSFEGLFNRKSWWLLRCIRAGRGQHQWCPVYTEKIVWRDTQGRWIIIC